MKIVKQIFLNKYIKYKDFIPMLLIARYMIFYSKKILRFKNYV